MSIGQQTAHGRVEAPEPVILTTGEVAEVLGLKAYQLAYLLETQQIPGPRKTLLGRRAFYTRGDLERIREQLQQRPKAIVASARPRR
jgi:hypothetical protein